MTPSMLLILACADEAPSTPATPAAPPLTKVRLALNWYPEPEFGGFYEAELGGIYEKAGFDVEIIPGGPGAPTLELLSTGQAEAAISAADDLLVKRSKGVKAKAVWAGFQWAPNGVMVHEGAATSFADLTGTVAIEVGSPFQTFLWKKMGWEGKVQAVPYGGTLGPFVADPKLAQQAYITSEPCVAQSQGVKTTFLKAADAGWNPYGVVLTVAEPAPAWTADFVKATQAGWEAYLAAPARANAEISRLNPQMKPELMDCVTKAQEPFVRGDEGVGKMNAARWDAMAATLVELGLLPAGSTAAEAWTQL